MVPRLTQVLNPKGSSIGAAIFAGLTSVTDRPTDSLTYHATRLVRIGRIYVHSTAMRLNNSSLKELSLILAIFGRFLLHGNVADVYNILSCVKNFTGVNFFNRD